MHLTLTVSYSVLVSKWAHEESQEISIPAKIDEPWDAHLLTISKKGDVIEVLKVSLSIGIGVIK